MSQSERYFLLQENGNEYKRTFPAFENNAIIKIIVGAMIESCIVEKRIEDLKFFQHYLEVLRTRFKEKKYYDLEIIETKTYER